MRLLLLLLIAGCTPLTEQQRWEREYEHRLTFEKWQFCRKAYSQNNIIWFSSFSIDERRIARGRMPNRFDMKYDMTVNGCGPLLRANGYD